jgi:hypothetical protein
MRMRNDAPIVRIELTQAPNGRWEGVVLCHHGNIDPEEYVTWRVACDDDMLLDAAWGNYIIGLSEANEDFNRRSKGFVRPIRDISNA